MAEREIKARTLQLQARLERNLAARQTDPELKRMIENSAVGKEEMAHEVRTGRPVDPEQSKYEQRTERSQPQKVIVKARR